ncbi:DUF4232 domain-containing protein [Amycolatopsis pigmentata]|uniref:DUF4232 domain-containing protein n=1 Tax=Amycolatopsis pigmentata TaxID=450801 RepID=A0ABW5FW78_9PSEU
MARQRFSQIGLAVTGMVLGAAVAACGGGNNAQPAPGSAAVSTPQTEPAPSSSAVSQAVPPAAAGSGASGAAGSGLCRSSDLRLSLGRGDAAAGTVYRPLEFTNISDHPCVLDGFPGVSYVGGPDGHQVGAPANREGDKGTSITLGKGEVASAMVGFANVNNYDPVTCQPQPVRGLRVYPPQETASLYIDMPTTGCGNDKIPGDQLKVKAIQKGTGS